jgi:hypothetical protein
MLNWRQQIKMKPGNLFHRAGKITPVWAAGLLAGFGLVAAGRADQDFGDITVSANAIYTGNTYHGYAEVRVLVQNRSHGTTHVVTLVSPDQAWDNGNRIGRLTRSATLAPETSEVLTLLQPPLPMPGDGQIHVELDGHSEGDINAPNRNGHVTGYYYGSPQPSVTLISRGLDFNTTDMALGTNAVVPHGHTYHGGHYYPVSPGGPASDPAENLRAETDVSDWSDNWLAYSPFDAVVVGADDLNAMPPPVFEALGDYLAAGGNIILAGQTGLPSAWHAWRKENLSDGTQYEIGFGHCFTFGSKNLSTLDDESIRVLREAVRESATYWRSLPGDANAANAAFPVVNNLKIPTRGIVAIMLAFIILIGPVNIIVLNRRKRRTWMLWTIPAISFATTMLVFAYSLLREGITPDTRIAGLTVLDQTSHHAATVGAAAFYCPLTPGGGLNFEFGTEATPLVQLGYGSGTAREVDWTQSQHFQRGWISSRVPAHFHLRKTETRRERIQVVNEDGKLQIINSLGAPVKSLWLADKDMNIYKVDNVDAGQKGVLAFSTLSGGLLKSGAGGLWRTIGFTAPTDSLDARAYLLPNTYIAVLDGNPFIENALGAAASPKRTRSSAVVFGILDPNDMP